MVRSNKIKKGGYKSKTSKRSLSKRAQRKAIHSKKRTHHKGGKTHKKYQKRIQKQRRHKTMKGGNAFKKVVPFLPPGGGSSNGMSNGKYYYKLNKYKADSTPGFRDTQPVPPQLQNGGGLVDWIPRDLVDLGRSLKGSVAKGYNTYMGQKTATSLKDPLAFQQPALEKNSKLNDYTPDVQSIINSSYETAANV